MRMRQFLPVAATAVAALAFITAQIRAQDDRRGEHHSHSVSWDEDSGNAASWISAGNGLSDDHDAPRDFRLFPAQINLLENRWTFSADGEVQGTPTVDRNQIYFSDSGGSVWRVDARSGMQVWKASLPSITGNSGSYSRVSPALSRDLLVIGDQASGTVIALSRDTGAPAWQTVLATDQGAIITGSPVIADGRIYVGVSSNQETLADTTPNFVPTFRGSIAALDLRDGHILWQTYTVPPGYTGGSVFGSNPGVDRRRATVYVGTGNNYSVPATVAACQLRAATAAERANCLAPNDYIETVLALDMNTGAIRWTHRFTAGDTWTVSCSPDAQPAATPCPVPTGIDADFAAGPNLFTIHRHGQLKDVVGIGRKNGAYYALDRDTGAVVWGTQVSPDGPRGGIEWSTATDGRRVYVPSANSGYVETTLIPSGVKTNGGFWSALDADTGQILWQTPTFAPAPTPQSPRSIKPPPGALAEAEGSVTTANGILFGEDAAGNFVALDGGSGRILWTFASGGAGIAGPAISGSSLYWSSGYKGIGPTNNKVYAFSLDNR